MGACRNKSHGHWRGALSLGPQKITSPGPERPPPTEPVSWPHARSGAICRGTGRGDPLRGRRGPGRLFLQRGIRGDWPGGTDPCPAPSSEAAGAADTAIPGITWHVQGSSQILKTGGIPIATNQGTVANNAVSVAGRFPAGSGRRRWEKNKESQNVPCFEGLPAGLPGHFLLRTVAGRRQTRGKTVTAYNRTPVNTAATDRAPSLFHRDGFFPAVSPSRRWNQGGGRGQTGRVLSISSNGIKMTPLSLAVVGAVQSGGL